MESQVSVPHVQVANEDEPSVEVDGGNFGCTHYRRRCKIKAPCCDEVFDCRHCHNEIKNSLEIDPIHRHDVPRHDVKKVVFVSYVLYVTLNKMFNKIVSAVGYVWGITSVKHANSTTMMFRRISTIVINVAYVEQVARRISFIATNVVNNKMKNLYIDVATRKRSKIHTCVWKGQCTMIVLFVLRYSCPICSKSICDLSDMWRKLDNEVEATPMPETYKNKMVWILCNDCEKISRVKFHIVGQKCTQCKSYNTRQIRGGPSSSVSCTSSVSDEDVN
ncbi:Rubredoxin-type fold [Cynara cardunculus var. scolymus]|uniref:Rubredoxin-type fold n=1 Tax=Cynara cardunculus var. scolymus TaxID=59895 RepID=A0A118K095_CYNCS|nr:Rubredoxin-type fold [Cynara cardunculus var. scolymus]